MLASPRLTAMIDRLGPEQPPAGQHRIDEKLRDGRSETLSAQDSGFTAGLAT